ncbi:polysaccharide deacetylase family protein [bacterium]|nr:polysaccharide deacetylase family protein [bacterium]
MIRPISQIAPLLARGWQTHCKNAGEAAITFDDGPDPKTTPMLLKTLDDLGLKATMFVVGQKCKGNRSLLQEIAAQGHSIACHGYSHEKHWFREPSFVQASVRQSLYILQDFGVKMELLFRPPYGAIDWRLHKRVTEIGAVPVLWSAHVRDWKPQEDSALLTRMSAAVHDRMILLMHDGHVTTPQVISQLWFLRDRIESMGLKSVALKCENAIRIVA